MRGVDLHTLGFHAPDLCRQVIAHDKRHTEHRTHRRTHHLRRVHIHAVTVHEDAIDPRRLCGTENRAHVARILQRVENQEEVARKLRVLLLPHHRQDALTVFRVGHVLHQLARHLKNFRRPLRHMISLPADVRWLQRMTGSLCCIRARFRSRLCILSIMRHLACKLRQAAVIVVRHEDPLDVRHRNLAAQPLALRDEEPALATRPRLLLEIPHLSDQFISSGCNSLHSAS